jgi:hypothetical protein
MKPYPIFIIAALLLFIKCSKDAPGSNTTNNSTGNANTGTNTSGGPKLSTVYFYHADQTLSPVFAINTTFDPAKPLIKVTIGDSSRAISGIWGAGYAPRCPVISDYLADPETFASFSLAPGSYDWKAESIPTNMNLYPSMTDSVISFWLAPHKVSGKITLAAGESCLLQQIVF